MTGFENSLTGTREKLSRLVRDQVQAFRSRPGRWYALLAAPRGGICAEIGVWAGGFSARIVQLRKPRELHLIDPWLFAPTLPERMYGGAVATDQAYMDALMASVVKRFANDPGVKVHRRSSLEGAQSFKDGYFDWVYLDGDHSQESVLADLKAWLPKVKNGGVIVCDDYTWVDERRAPSVKTAIEIFMRDNPGCSGHLFFGQYLIRKIHPKH